MQAQVEQGRASEEQKALEVGRLQRALAKSESRVARLCMEWDNAISEAEECLKCDTTALQRTIAELQAELDHLCKQWQSEVETNILIKTLQCIPIIVHSIQMNSCRL